MWICELSLLTVRREKLYLTIFVSGELELGVKVSSLQMENNTIYLSLVRPGCPPLIASIYSAIYIKRGLVLWLRRTGGLHTVLQITFVSLRRIFSVNYRSQFLLSATSARNISIIDDYCHLGYDVM